MRRGCFARNLLRAGEIVVAWGAIVDRPPGQFVRPSGGLGISRRHGDPVDVAALRRKHRPVAREPRHQPKVPQSLADEREHAQILGAGLELPRPVARRRPPIPDGAGQVAEEFARLQSGARIRSVHAAGGILDHRSGSEIVIEGAGAHRPVQNQRHGSPSVAKPDPVNLPRLGEELHSPVRRRDWRKRRDPIAAKHIHPHRVRITCVRIRRYAEINHVVRRGRPLVPGGTCRTSKPRREHRLSRFGLRSYQVEFNTTLFSVDRGGAHEAVVSRGQRFRHFALVGARRARQDRYPRRFRIPGARLEVEATRAVNASPRISEGDLRFPGLARGQLADGDGFADPRFDLLGNTILAFR